MTGQSIPDNQMALSYDNGIDTATVTKTRRPAAGRLVSSDRARRKRDRRGE